MLLPLITFKYKLLKIHRKLLLSFSYVGRYLSVWCCIGLEENIRNLKWCSWQLIRYWWIWIYIHLQHLLVYNSQSSITRISYFDLESWYETFMIEIYINFMPKVAPFFNCSWVKKKWILHNYTVITAVFGQPDFNNTNSVFHMLFLYCGGDL